MVLEQSYDWKQLRGIWVNIWNSVSAAGIITTSRQSQQNRVHMFLVNNTYTCQNPFKTFNITDLLCDEAVAHADLPLRDSSTWRCDFFAAYQTINWSRIRFLWIILVSWDVDAAKFGIRGFTPPWNWKMYRQYVNIQPRSFESSR